ncbi:MAG: flagellar assembly protein FliX [Methyloligellaceae bacterium]
MRVAQTRRSNATQTTRSARSAGARDGQFQLPERRATTRRAEISGPARVGSVDTLVALQAVEDPSDRRRKAVKTGDNILDLLDKLKIGLLSDQVSVTDLDALKTTIERQQSLESDPELNDVLKQIDLRARVELAKLKGAKA